MPVKMHPLKGGIHIKHRPLPINRSTTEWPVLSFPDPTHLMISQQGRYWNLNNPIGSVSTLHEESVGRDEVLDAEDTIANLDDHILTQIRKFGNCGVASLGNVRPKLGWATRRTIRQRLDLLIKRGEIKRKKGRRHSWRYSLA